MRIHDIATVQCWRAHLSVEGIVLLGSLPIPVLAGLFWHWRVYSLYKLLGDRASEAGYYWFAFQVQNPNFSRQLSGHVDLLESLPQDLSAQVLAVRRQIRDATLAMAFWMLLVFVLIALSFGR